MPAAWGFEEPLGFAVTTRLGFPIWHLLPGAALTADSLWFGPAVWGAYGVVRTGSAWAMMRLMERRTPDAVLDAVAAVQPRVRRAAGALVAGGSVALGVASCGGGAAEPAEATAPSASTPAVAARADETVDCARRAMPAPSGDLADQAGVRVASATVGDARLRLFTFGGEPSRMRVGDRRVWVWKVPAELSAGGDATVRVAGAQPGAARLVFGARPESFAAAPRAVRFVACGAEQAPRTGWGGSVATTRRRACLRLRVRATAGGERARLRLPLGRRCR